MLYSTAELEISLQPDRAPAMSTIPDRNPPIFSPSVLGGVIKPGPRFSAMHAFHGRQLAADQASHIVSYRNAVEA